MFLSRLLPVMSSALVVILLVCTNPAHAGANNEGNYYFVNAGSLNVRAEKNTGSRIVGKLERDDMVRVVDKAIFSSWWEIDSPVSGFIHSKYLSDRAQNKQLYVTSETLNVRQAATTNSSIVGKLSQGEAVKVVRMTRSGNWWEIESPLKGFVYADFLSEDHDESEHQATVSSGSDRDHHFVVGGGISIHFFFSTDDTRGGGDDFGNAESVFYTMGTRLYGEWYYTDKTGFGALMNRQTASRTYTDSGLNADIEQNWDINHFFLTFNFLPFGFDRWTDMVLYGGIGRSQVTYEESADSSSIDSVSEQTSGTAFTGGIILDLGGDGFGVRLGAQYINSSYDSIKIRGREYEISTDGVTLHSDLRWAF